MCGCYLAGALALPGHEGAALADGQLKVLQHGGQGGVGSSGPLEALLDAGLQHRQLLLRGAGHGILLREGSEPASRPNASTSSQDCTGRCIYMYSFSRRFDPKRLPRDKVHRSLITR